MRAPANTRLGQLQRGRGAGFLAAIADPVASRDDVVAWILDDAERDSQVEKRARYGAELVARLDVPLEPIVAHAARFADDEPEGRLAYEVLAAAWVREHAPARAVLARGDLSSCLLDGITRELWGHRWTTREQLPPRAARRFERLEVEWGPSESTSPGLSVDARQSIAGLLDLACVHRGPADREIVRAELLRRTGAGDRDVLADIVAGDPEPARVRLAAEVLGCMGDARLLPLAETLFRREHDLDGADIARARRHALLHYVMRLPGAITLPLARAWHSQGDYLQVAATRVLQEHAEPADREWIEADVRRRLPTDGGCGYASDLGPLARIADPRSAPLFAEVCELATYSYARVQALRGLARMLAVPVARALLREALWDAEDDAVALACSLPGELDAAARQRLGELSQDPCLDGEVRAAVVARRG
ncbi:MAG: hypothetical protein WAT39_17270 [Planctomycetota bacterium]